jgi:glycosyltransferase involved in cell wall biosynthesis
MRILLDMRPALDGHSGIPQETRLLFRGLAQLPGVDVIGLLQSGNLVLEKGLPLTKDGRLASDGRSAEDMDRLSQVVVSMLQGPASHKLAWLRKRFLEFAGPMAAGTRSLLGLRTGLTGFEPTQFKDFVWRSMFAKTLPVSDFDAVTQREFRILRWPWSRVNQVGVATGAMGHATYPRLDTRGIDLFVAETPFPGRVSGRTRMVVRYHDAMPILMPHTVKDRGYHRAMHFHALQRNARDGAWFACVSDASRADLLSVMPALEPRAVTIPNMVSHHFHAEPEGAARVPEVIWSRKNRSAPHGGGRAIAEADAPGGALPYLLMVSTVEPRKNHAALLDAWELLRAGRHPGLHLVCVGSLGWDHQAMLARFAPWLERGGLHLLEGVPADDLRLLYRHARATVCPSLAEGFDFSGVEAMASGGVVAASDIRVHRDIYDDAADYFSAYAPAEMAAVIDRLIDPAQGSAPQALAARVARGAAVAARYSPQAVLPQWQRFLEDLHAGQA